MKTNVRFQNGIVFFTCETKKFRSEAIFEIFSTFKPIFVDQLLKIIESGLCGRIEVSVTNFVESTMA